jgi:lysophospholipase L1-like esterase
VSTVTRRTDASSTGRRPSSGTAVWRLAKRAAFSVLTFFALAALLEGGARLAVRPEALPLLAAPLDGNFNLPVADVFAYDPELFWKLRPGLRLQGTASAPWGDVTNELGLRMSRELLPDGRPRVLCLGDSCTYGLGVAVADAWPSLLNADFDAVNAGVPGYSSFQCARSCARLAPIVRADCVVVQVGVNDLMPWITSNAGRTVMLTDRERAEEVALRDLASRSRFAGWVFAKASAPTPVDVPHFDYHDWTGLPARVPLDETVRNVKSMCASARACVVIAWPGRKLLLPDFVCALPVSRLSESYLRILGLRSEGFRVVDVLDAFVTSRRSADDLFLDGVHASPLGCRLVADAVRTEVAAALAAASTR